MLVDVLVAAATDSSRGIKHSLVLVAVKRHSCHGDDCCKAPDSVMPEGDRQDTHCSQAGKFKECHGVHIISGLDLRWPIKNRDGQCLLCVCSHEVCQIYTALYKDTGLCFEVLFARSL